MFQFLATKPDHVILTNKMKYYSQYLNVASQHVYISKYFSGTPIKENSVPPPPPPSEMASPSLIALSIYFTNISHFDFV